MNNPTSRPYSRRQMLKLVGVGSAGMLLAGCIAPPSATHQTHQTDNNHKLSEVTKGEKRMNTYVFIHGSWHGAWCWYKIVPLLEAAGHKAIAIDLPGHGRDWTAAGDVTMQSYVDSVVKVLDEQAEPVILVGHSRGGIVISQTAEARPDKIKVLVYLAAFLIPNGEPMIQTALSDSESLIVANLNLNEAAGWHMLKEEAFKDALYGDCSAEDLALARSLLTPEPNAPVGTPLQLSESNFGRIPRVYIETLQDKGVTPGVQKKMYTATPCQQVLSLNTSHSPFLSAPQSLVEHLLTAAEVGSSANVTRLGL
jgi:pimeloyl-ACP methyl ester carboxylesterase